MFTLTPTLGALEVAILISSLLYGVTTLQAWMYAENYSTDQRYLRVMVPVLPMFRDYLLIFSVYVGWHNLVCIDVNNTEQPL